MSSIRYVILKATSARHISWISQSLVSLVSFVHGMHKHVVDAAALTAQSGALSFSALQTNEENRVQILVI
jgi:hypothetical protein